jgi:hypothetical protein
LFDAPPLELPDDPRDLFNLHKNDPQSLDVLKPASFTQADIRQALSRVIALNPDPNNTTFFTWDLPVLLSLAGDFALATAPEVLTVNLTAAARIDPKNVHVQFIGSGVAAAKGEIGGTGVRLFDGQAFGMELGVIASVLDFENPLAPTLMSTASSKTLPFDLKRRSFPKSALFCRSFTPMPRPASSDFRDFLRVTRCSRSAAPCSIWSAMR